MKTKKPKSYPFAERFMKLLHERMNLPDGELYATYYHLFAILDDDELDNDLSYHYSVYIGKDPYFKNSGKTHWFHNFHKSIRSGDYFRDSYRKTNETILTELESKELSFLRNKIYTEGYKKEGGEDSMFNDEYKRYLELVRIKKSETQDKSIGGHLDMILWHVIHVDKKNILSKTLKLVFSFQQVGV